MKIVYQDPHMVVCVKPAGLLAQADSKGGDSAVARLEKDFGSIYPVHRLDKDTGGVMVFARSAKAASLLSEQIRQRQFGKAYLAVVHGKPQADNGTLTDLLGRDKARKMTFVVAEPGKDVQPASLTYRVLGSNGTLSRVRIKLETGRTHQIRVQFSSRGLPLVGERKYSELDDPCEIALWSYRLAFTHPKTGEKMEFTHEPPREYPWTEV